MVNVELDLDIAALVGEMGDLECEHSQHLTLPEHHGGKAAAYVRAIHSCGPPTEAYVACESFVARINSGRLMRCSQCLDVIAWDEAFEVLGPVKS